MSVRPRKISVLPRVESSVLRVAGYIISLKVKKKVSLLRLFGMGGRVRVRTKVNLRRRRG